MTKSVSPRSRLPPGWRLFLSGVPIRWRTGPARDKGPPMAENPFTKHPHEVGESYPEHFGMAARFGVRMIAGGLACFVHAVFPFLCERTGSETVRELNAKLGKRV